MAADPTPPTPGPVVPAGPQRMLDLGGALGADIWWLEQLFAVAGGWVASTPEAGVRTHLAELSRVAGDHAVALRGVLPRPAPVDPAGWVRPPSDRAARIPSDLAACAASATRLVVAHRVVVTRLVTAWAIPLGPSAVGVARAVRHARTDLADLRDEGEALLHVLFGADPDLVVPTAVAAAEVEAVVAAAGARPAGPSALPT